MCNTLTSPGRPNRYGEDENAIGNIKDMISYYPKVVPLILNNRKNDLRESIRKRYEGRNADVRRNGKERFCLTRGRVVTDENGYRGVFASR